MTPMSVHMGLLTDYDFAKHNLFIRVDLPTLEVRLYLLLNPFLITSRMLF